MLAERSCDSYKASIFERRDAAAAKQEDDMIDRLGRAMLGIKVNIP